MSVYLSNEVILLNGSQTRKLLNSNDGYKRILGGIPFSVVELGKISCHILLVPLSFVCVPEVKFFNDLSCTLMYSHRKK